MIKGCFGTVEELSQRSTTFADNVGISIDFTLHPGRNEFLGPLLLVGLGEVGKVAWRLMPFEHGVFLRGHDVVLTERFNLEKKTRVPVFIDTPVLLSVDQ